MQQLSTINDGAAFSYQQEGHTFYVVSFPRRTRRGSLTSTGEWHRRGYWDPNVMAHAVYSAAVPCVCVWGIHGLGLNLVGDRASGRIMALKPQVGTDMDGVVIRRMRQAPHLADRDQEVTFDRVQMDMDVG